MKTYNIIILLGNGNIMRTKVKADYYAPSKYQDHTDFFKFNQTNTAGIVINQFPTSSIIVSEEELVDSDHDAIEFNRISNLKNTEYNSRYEQLANENPKLIEIINMCIDINNTRLKLNK